MLLWTKETESKTLLSLTPALSIPYKISNEEAFPIGKAPLVFVLGKDRVDHLSAAGALPKNRSIKSLREQVFTYPGTSQKFMVSYNPSVMDTEYAWYVDLLCDTKLAIRYLKTGSLKPNYGHYQYVSDFKEVLTAIVEKFTNNGSTPVEVALDTETLGLNPYNPKAWIITIQVTVEPGFAHVVHFPTKDHFDKWLLKYKWQLEWICQKPIVSLRMANGKYDCNWLYEKAGIEVTNFKFDTTLVGSLLDENRSNALDVHAKIYTEDLGGYSDTFDITYDKSRMDLVPVGDLLKYSGGDSDATYRVAQAMRKELTANKQLANFYIHLLHPAARAYEVVERTGVCVDLEAFKQLEVELSAQMKFAVYNASKIVGGRLVAKHLRDSTNILKPAFLVDFLFSPMGLNLKPLKHTEKSEKPSTAMDHLMMFREVPAAKEFLKCVEEYQSASKTLSTFVTGFLSHLREDGRLHPNYFLHRGNKDEGEGGTNTGRLSARDPAWQVLPKHTAWAKRIRACYPAPPGYVILALDYSQGELKIIACIANETNMIAAYASGMDLHAYTAGSFKGYTYDQMRLMAVDNPELYAAIRQLGKAGNFGLIYGMGVDGFITYANDNYGVSLTYDEGNSFRNGFFERYPGLTAYHKKYKSDARKHKKIITPLGRVRHLPLITSPFSQERSKSERQAINSPVQATLSDLSLLATVEMHKRGWLNTAPVFGMVHDQLLLYVPEDQALEHAKNVKEVMENLPLQKFGWHPQLQFTVDCEIGPNLGALKKTKLH